MTTTPPWGEGEKPFKDTDRVRRCYLSGPRVRAEVLKIRSGMLLSEAKAIAQLSDADLFWLISAALLTIDRTVLVRREFGATAELVLRACLCCEREFASEGAHNRLCAHCKATRA